MGWTMPWFSMTDEFDADFGVDEWHGTNAFIRDGDRVFRTYFINNRGDEALGGTWSYLDLTALGRQEEWRTRPRLSPDPPYEWWNWHDEYTRRPAGAGWPGQDRRGRRRRYIARAGHGRPRPRRPSAAARGRRSAVLVSGPLDRLPARV